MSKFDIETLDKKFISELHSWGVPVLRTALGAVFLWFGLLKMVGRSPIEGFVHSTYSFVPIGPFMLVLGVWESLIGLGLLSKSYLRLTLLLLWLQMAGTLATIVIAPHFLFQDGNIFLLTTEGEFVVKNFVLIAASLIVGGYEVKPWQKKTVRSRPKAS